MNKIIISYLVVSSLVCIYGEVPVFTWSNQVDLSFPQVFAGHSKSQQDFQHEYLNSEVPTLLVFVQKQISISDILVNGGVYGSNQENSYEQLKTIMESYISSYMPAVEKPIESIFKLANDKKLNFKKISKAGMTDEDKLKEELAGLVLKERNLILVDFTDYLEADQKQIDSLIGSMVSYFKASQQHFLAFYTAKHDSQADVDSDPVISENSRHLMATESSEEEEVKPVHDDNFIISFDHIFINGEMNNFTMKDVEIKENTCPNMTSTIIAPATSCSVLLNLGAKDSLKDVQLSFAVSSSGTANPGFWYVKTVQLSYSENDKAKESFVMMGGLVDPTPYGFSYSCYQGPALLSYDNNKIGAVTLQFEGLQLQAFSTDANFFGHYNDCVGFFTTGIWMFLIVAIILISILFFGIKMVMNIDTMDRYDDPKGKTIIVSNTD